MNFLTPKVKKASKAVANNKIKKLSLAIGLSCTLLSQQVLALTLSSETNQQSVHIFQPLDIKVELIDKNNEVSKEDIFVNIASQRAFDKLGLDRHRFLSKINVSLETDSIGTKFVHITSKELVKEPFLMLLLELTWPNGHLFKDYTILFDAPITQNRKIDAPVILTKQAISPVINKQIENKVQINTDNASQVQNPIDNKNQQYTVQKTDTLWEIALKTRQQDDISIQQMMLSIQDKNPSAFVNNNINIIKAGAVLNIPSAQETLARSESVANQEVYSQNQLKTDYTQSNLEQLTQPEIIEVDPETESIEKNVVTESTKPRTNTGQLRLVTSDESILDTKSASGNQDSVIDSLENDLAIAMDIVEKEQREKQEKQTLISELEEQNETLQKILDLKSQELAELQRQLSQQNVADTTVDDMLIEDFDNSIDENDILDLDVSEDIEQIDEGVQVEFEEANLSEVDDLINHLAIDDGISESENDVVDNEIESNTTIPENLIQDAVDQNETVKSEANIISKALQWLTGSYINMAIAGVSGLLLLVLIASLFTRKKRNEEIGNDIYDSMDDLDELAVNDDFEDDLLSDIDLGSDEFATIDQSDALEEAQKLIDYGNLDQAIEILEVGYQEDHSRNDLAIKLLELYGQTSQNDKFADLEARVSINAPSSLINQIETLNAQYHPSKGNVNESLIDDLESLDLDSINIEDSLEAEEIELELEHSGKDALDDLDLDDLDDLDFESIDIKIESEDESLELDAESFDIELEEKIEQNDDDLELEITLNESLADLDLEETKDSIDLDKDDNEDAFEIELDDEFLATTTDDKTEEFEIDLDEDLSEISIESELEDISLDSFKISSELESDTELTLETSDDDESFDLSLDELDSEIAELDAQFSTETSNEENETDEEIVSMTAEDVEHDAEIEDEIESEIDFMGDNDENSTKLNLAKAFIEMGDVDSAKEMLEEIIEEGNDEQKIEAKKMIESL